MRIKLDEKYLNSIKSQIIRKFNLSPEIIKRMNEGSFELYVENLQEQQNALMQSRTNEIAIDKQFCTFDQNGNITGFQPHLKRLIISQLGHELLHAASKGNNISGIKGLNKTNNTGLNEGITQMFTEDIFSYVVSPFTDGYTDYKKIAKMIRVCIGDEPFKKSYFNHTNDLEVACNKMANSQTFFDDLNKALTDLYILKRSAKTTNKKQSEIVRTIYNDRIKVCFANVIINIVIPKMKTLQTEEEKKQLINSILNEVSDNREIFAQVNTLLRRELFMNDQQLKTEQEHIRLYDEHAILKTKIIDLSGKNQLTKDMFIINRTGKVEYKNSDGTLKDITKDEDLCTIVYTMFYDRYFKIDMGSYLDNIIKTGKPLEFNSSLHPLHKFIFLAKMKLVAADRGIKILNTFQEVQQSDSIEITMVNKDLSFNDLRTLLERYDYRALDIDNIHGKHLVVDKKTNQPIKDVTIINGVKVAYMWLSTYQHRHIDESIPGITDSFSDTNEKLFNELINMLVNNVEKKGEMDVRGIYSYASKHKNTRMLKIIEVILRNPSTYENMYSFVSAKAKERVLQVQKERSYIEEQARNYTDIITDVVVEEIFAGPKK